MKNSRLALLLVMAIILSIAMAGCGSEAQTAAPAAAPSGAVAPAAEAEPVANEDYPTRNIDFYIGFGSGGGTDNFCRTISIDAEKELGVTVVCQNKEGGSSVTATEYALKQPADGYTLVSVNPELLQNYLLGRTDKSYRDIKPILRAHVDVGSFIVSPTTPFQTFEEFVDYAKANPGKVSLGGTGSASFDEFACASALKQLGVDVSYVSYESASDMQAAVLGGHLDMMYEEPGNVIELLKSGDLKALVFFCDEPLKGFEDVPVFGQLGYEVQVMNWRGLGVSADTPDYIVEKLIEAFKASWDGETYSKFASERYLDLYDGLLLGQDFYDAMAAEEEGTRQVMIDLGYIDG